MTISQIQLAPGSVATIENVSWDEFESILRELGEKRISRVAYSKGTLEIMVPLPEHEKPIIFNFRHGKNLAQANG